MFHSLRVWCDSVTAQGGGEGGAANQFGGFAPLSRRSSVKRAQSSPCFRAWEGAKTVALQSRGTQPTTSMLTTIHGLLRKLRSRRSQTQVGHLYLPNAIAVMKMLSSMRKKHGKIFAFWPGNTPMVVVMEPKAVRQILTDTRQVSRRINDRRRRIICFLFDRAFLMMSGDSENKTPIV